MSQNAIVSRGRALAVLVMLAAAVFTDAAFASGTPAGTAIQNSVTLTFSRNGAPAESLTAAAPAVVVAKVISVLVTSQDGAPVPTASPDPERPLSFLVTNTGNGTETFSLSRNNAVAGDQFDPANAAAGAIWIESGAQPGFQSSGPAADIAYIAGSNDLLLPADASRVAYLLSSIPAGQATGATGKAALTAASTTPGAAGAAPGTLIGTSAGVQTVVGAGRAQGSASGSYLVAGVSVGLAKSVSAVRDPSGGTRVMSGSVLTYRLVLTLQGSGVANALTVNDPLPAAVSYVPGSLTVDGVQRTDAADADNASFAGGAVQASFGSVTAPASRVIEFQATVN